MSKPFKIPFQVAPTLEEHRAASAEWLRRVAPCLYENWPNALKAMSFPTRLVCLSRADQDEIGAGFDDKWTDHRATLVAKIDAEISGDVFAKLSSRSAKDAWCDTLKCRSALEILGQFTSSESILDDLIEYKYADTDCYLLLREWQDIPKHEEWRCFIRGRRIIGITQYHYTDDFRCFYGTHEATICERLQNYLNETVIPSLHVDPVVVDVWLRDAPTVIEINPYGSSDPCLLTYAELANGDCGFRTRLEAMSDEN